MPDTGETPRQRIRSSAKSFFARLSRAKVAKEEALTPPRAVPTPELAPKLIRRVEALVYAEQMRKWLIASAASNLVTLLILVGVLISTWFRPVYSVQGQSTLSELAKTFYDDLGVDRDQIYLFVTSTLTTLNQVSPTRGAPFLPLLQGSIDPKIYSRATADIARTFPEIKKNLLTQSLVIKDIPEIMWDSEAKKISVYVIGDLTVVAQQAAKGQKALVIPYRARVVIDPTTPSKINPYPYYIVGLTQRFDRAALNWDKEQLRKQ